MLTTEVNHKPLVPPLKWAGGKRWQVPHVAAFWMPHFERRLVEPFCGGLAIALGLRPQQALLNDANPHLVNFYRWIKKGLRPSIEMKKDERLFYRHRDRFNELVRAGRQATREAAELFYYMNRTAYNGLCRFNSRGEFNVPFGQYKTVYYAESFDDYRSTFSGWDFTTGDFANLSLRPDDFEALAHAFAAAGERLKAIDYSRRAGDRAAALAVLCEVAKVAAATRSHALLEQVRRLRRRLGVC